MKFPDSDNGPGRKAEGVPSVELLVHSGPAMGFRQVIARFPTVVGRGKDADVRLADDPSSPTLSRSHLLIKVGDRGIVIEDLSTNGTWVGSRRLERGEPRVVDDGEHITLGPRTIISLRLLSPTAATGVPQQTPISPAQPAVFSAAATSEGTLGTMSSEVDIDRIPLRVETLGMFRVTVDELLVPDSAWNSRKPMVLLACLADNAGRVMAASRIGELLWPDSQDTARPALQTAASRLRRSIMSVRAGMPDPVNYEHGGYRISEAYQLFMDVPEFESAADAAMHSAGPDRAHHLEKAVSLFKGSFLDGHTDDWVQARRRILDGQYFDVVDALAEVRVSQGRTADAVRLLAGVLEREPCREQSQVGMLRALIAAGRFDEAIRQYHVFVRTLKKMLGLEPGEELVRLYESLQRRGSSHIASFGGTDGR